MKENKGIKKVSWLPVGFSILITCFWAYWGANEAFHEGWYFRSLWMNIGLSLLQYLSPMLVFLVVGLISIYWPRIGGALHIAVAIFAAWFFNIFSNTVIFFLLLPLIGIGILYWRGNLPPKKSTARWMLGLPLLVFLASAIIPAYRVSQRISENSLEAQLVYGNQISLTWAPSGPGWPTEGTTWADASQACQLLNQDGRSLSAQPQNIWRLPTVDEAVRSMSLHGVNSQGTWDDLNRVAIYEHRPDKEFPLWDSYSQIIYWWTATEIDQKTAYIIVYDGKVWERSKQMDIGNLGFRCVK